MFVEKEVSNMATHPNSHSQFKIFVGTSLDDINNQVQTFVSSTSAPVSPKSIGVERAEGQFLVSLGYDKGAGQPRIQLKSVALGRIPVTSPGAIEVALNKAAQGVENLICHELYEAVDGDLVAVFLTHG
jgi:hypothetical protein